MPNPYHIDTGYLAMIANFGARGVSLRVADDPVTGVRELTIFTDDGHGNGEEVFTIPLAKLLRAISEATTEAEAPMTAEQLAAAPIGRLRALVNSTSPTGRYAEERRLAEAEIARRTEEARRMDREAFDMARRIRGRG